MSFRLASKLLPPTWNQRVSGLGPGDVPNPTPHQVTGSLLPVPETFQRQKTCHSIKQHIQLLSSSRSSTSLPTWGEDWTVVKTLGSTVRLPKFNPDAANSILALWPGSSLLDFLDFESFICKHETSITVPIIASLLINTSWNLLLNGCAVAASHGSWF
jgi:hypothetical protein